MEPTAEPKKASKTSQQKLSGIGATENQMNARGTVPQRVDSHVSKVEDLAGTGEQDSPGG